MKKNLTNLNNDCYTYRKNYLTKTNVKAKIILISIYYIVSFSILSSQENSVSDSIVSLNEVVVSAYHTNTLMQKIPGSISTISSNHVNATDGNSFSNTLHEAPGLFMHSGTYGTSRILIRGIGSRTPYNTNRIKFYLNDIPITSSDGISSPEDIDLLNIDRIEIVKGPASALYGSGLGGSINLFTPQRKAEKINLSVQYGSNNTLKTGVNGFLNSNNLEIYANATHLQSDGFRENNHFKRTSAISSGKWKQASYSIEYILLLLGMDSGIPSSISKTLYETNPSAAAINWKNISGYKKYNKGIAGVGIENKITKNLSNKLTVFSRWIDSYEKRPFNNLDDGTFSKGLRNKLHFQTKKWDATLGLELVSDDYKWELELNDAIINKNIENRKHLNLFGIAYFRPDEKWTLSVGGALNKITYQLTDQFIDNGDQSGSRHFPAVFSPRIGINFAPSSQIALFSSIGHGFSMPSPEETLLPEGDINKEIKPEQGIQTEAGVRLNLFDNFTLLEATFYHIQLSNLLVTKRLAEDIFTGINAGKTRHYGIEVQLEQTIFDKNIFPGNLNLRSNLTVSDNTFMEFTDNDIIYNGKKLPGIPTFTSQSSVFWQPVKSLIFNSQLQFIGKQYLNDANSGESSGYFTLNSKISYLLDVKKVGSLNLFLGANNVTNTHYAAMISVNALSIGGNEPRYYYPGMPRHFYGGIRIVL